MQSQWSKRWLLLPLLGFSFHADAAEVYSANLTLDPAYAPGSCALVSQNGYAGTDRQLFIPSVAGYYSVKDYSEAFSPYWFITVESFDPNQTLVAQSLASSANVFELPGQVYLEAGTRVYIWSGYWGGYGNSVANCEAAGSTKTVTGRIVGEDSGVPAPPTDLVATAISGGASIAFTAGSDNGSAITNYQVGFYDEEEEDWVYVALSPADATSPVVVSGFTNGVETSVRLKAVNANGAGTDSPTVAFTPAEVAELATPVPVLPGYYIWLFVALTGWFGTRRLSK
jgi:hypothetical protein